MQVHSTGQEKPSEGVAESRLSLAVGGDMEILTRSGEPLHLVLDDIKDYAVFMVSLDGLIASWNSGAEQLKGHTSKEAIGRPFAMLFTQEDVERGQPEREMQGALESGVYQGEGFRVRKDGSQFEAEVTLRLLRDAAGGPAGFVKVTRDITARKRMERLDHERADFEKELLGIVSHDLRSPLNAILLTSTMLVQNAGLDAKQRSALDRIASSARRATRLIRDLLDFTQARLGGGLPVQRVNFDLHELAQEVVAEVRLAHPKRTVTAKATGDGAVDWDPDRTVQLLTNLLNNALRYGDADREVSVRLHETGDVISIDVHNWGPVIPPETIPHVFERLTRGAGERAASGSIGLGLFIVNHIVRAHGGSIKVESTTEEGTTFSVRAPRSGLNVPAEEPVLQ